MLTRTYQTRKQSQIQVWSLSTEGSFTHVRTANLPGSWREFMVDRERLAVVDYAFNNIRIYHLPTLEIDERVFINRDPPGPRGVPFGSQLIFDCGCVYDRAHNKFIFGFSMGVQIVFGDMMHRGPNESNMVLYCHRGKPQADEEFGEYYIGDSSFSTDGWTVQYDRVLSRLVFYDSRSTTIFIWNMGTMTLMDADIAPGVEKWHNGPEECLHTLQLVRGHGVDAVHFASEEGLDDLICPHGRTMVVANRVAVHVFEVGGTHTRPGAPPERAGRPATLFYSIDLAENGPPGWIAAFEPDDWGHVPRWGHDINCGMIPNQSAAGGLLFAATLLNTDDVLSQNEQGDGSGVAWIKLNLSTLELTKSGDEVSQTDLAIASGRIDIASPDGRTFFLPRHGDVNRVLSITPDCAGGTKFDAAICRRLVRLGRRREARARNRAAPTGDATSGVCEAIFSSDGTHLQDAAAQLWAEGNYDFGRPLPPTFMLGNRLLVYNACRGNVKITVWAF